MARTNPEGFFVSFERQNADQLYGVVSVSLWIKQGVRTKPVQDQELDRCEVSLFHLALDALVSFRLADPLTRPEN